MKSWILAARPATLTAAAAPVAVGTAVAYAVGGFALGPALAALLGAFWIQIGTNFANDVFDAEKGADGPDRIGPTRAVSAGLISARAMKLAMIAAFALATAFGGYLLAVAGWPVAAIGVASILAGIAYTGGPYPLGYHGLGDLFVLVFFGFVAVCGTAFVQLGHVPQRSRRGQHGEVEPFDAVHDVVDEMLDPAVRRREVVLEHMEHVHVSATLR